MSGDITLSIVAANLFPFVTSAVFLLLFAGQRGVTPLEIGVIFASGSVSGLVGAQVARPLIRTGGLGPVMLAGAGRFSIGPLFTLGASFSPLPLVVPLLVASGAVGGFGLMVYNINQLAIRQAVVPDRMLGRANAGVLVVSLGGQVVGSLVGGAIGESVSLHAALRSGRWARACAYCLPSYHHSDPCEICPAPTADAAAQARDASYVGTTPSVAGASLSGR